MSTPTDHYLVVPGRFGKQIRGRVVDLRPIEEHATSATVVVAIDSMDWLEHHDHAATYICPTHSVPGIYSVHAYSRADGQWLFTGTFTCAEDTVIDDDTVDR